MPALPQARAARRSVRTATRRPSHSQHNDNIEIPMHEFRKNPLSIFTFLLHHLFLVVKQFVENN